MTEFATGLVAADLLPMEARLVEDLPTEPGWQFEPKWDGFRCLALRDGGRVELRAKSGRPLARYFPDIVMALRELEPSLFIVDGELAIPVARHCPSMRCKCDCIRQKAASASLPPKHRQFSSCSIC